MWKISVTRNFQGYFSRTFQDQSDFPGLSRSWNFKEKKSRTFQDFPGGVGTLYLDQISIRELLVYKDLGVIISEHLHGRKSEVLNESNKITGSIRLATLQSSSIPDFFPHFSGKRH